MLELIPWYTFHAKAIDGVNFIATSNHARFVRSDISYHITNVSLSGVPERMRIYYQF